MEKPYDGLIFDLDGTLWDSSASCAKGWNQALGGLGHSGRTITDKDIQGIMGLPKDQIFQKVFPEAAPGDREKIGDACYEREIAVIRSEGGVLFPGVEEGLERLGARFPLFIVSNCDEHYLDAFFTATNLRRCFKDAECYGATGKPKGDNIRLLATRNGLKHAAYVGDTAGDQIAAGRAGVAYFHVEYGFGEPNAACLKFADFGELTEFFLDSSL